MNLLYPRLGKENSPRLRLEWLPSGIISNQSLHLSSLHLYLCSFITPTSYPYPLNLVTLDSHIHHLVLELRLPFDQACSPNTFLKQKYKNNTNRQKPCKPKRPQASIWHGHNVLPGTTVPPLIFSIFKAAFKHGSPLHDRALPPPLQNSLFLA